MNNHSPRFIITLGDLSNLGSWAYGFLGRFITILAIIVVIALLVFVKDGSLVWTLIHNIIWISIPIFLLVVLPLLLIGMILKWLLTGRT